VISARTVGGKSTLEAAVLYFHYYYLDERLLAWYKHIYAESGGSEYLRWYEVIYNSRKLPEAAEFRTKEHDEATYE
jgi:hypothetical protein